MVHHNLDGRGSLRVWKCNSFTFSVVRTYGDQWDPRSQIISSLIFHQNRCHRALTERIRPNDGRGRGHRGLLMNMETLELHRHAHLWWTCVSSSVQLSVSQQCARLPHGHCVEKERKTTFFLTQQSGKCQRNGDARGEARRTQRGRARLWIWNLCSADLKS